MSVRILVTGSRSWTDRDTVRRALSDVIAQHAAANPIVLVHGAATGADTIADEAWREWMFRSVLADPERYPARDFPSPRARNQHMVDLGATVCLTFAHTWASGTGMCARMARRAGIPVIDVGVPTGPGDRP